MNFLPFDGLNVRRNGIALFGIKVLGGVYSLTGFVGILNLNLGWFWFWFWGGYNRLRSLLVVLL
jgi:hypothetical protein